MTSRWRYSWVAFAAGSTLLAQELPAQTPKSDPPSLFTMSLSELMNVPIMSRARKRDEVLLGIPAAVTVLSEQELSDYDLRSFTDYATRIPNLSFAYGNAFTVGNPATGISSARTIAIRGLSGPRTTGFYIDDIPLPGSVNVRLMDLESLEILKGPQGTLFGESSLGGNVRLITKAPSLEHHEFKYRLGAGQTLRGGRINTEAELIGNVVLSPATALRFVASHSDDAGYLTRSYLSDISNPGSSRLTVDNQGAQRTVAGSLTGLARVTEDLNVSLRFMYQDQHHRGFPATWAPLPGFQPVHAMSRQANLQPAVQDTWTLPALTMIYAGDGWTLNSSTSLFTRRTQDLEDSTEGTLQIYQGALPPQPVAWTSQVRIQQFAHETRVAFDQVDRWSGTAGVFFSRNRTDYAIPPVFAHLANGTPELLWREDETNVQRDLAIFGEVYVKFLDKATLTLGARQYWLRQSDEHDVLLGASLVPSRGDTNSTGLSPKVALSYQPSSSAMVYASWSKGFRQGNPQLNPELLGAGPELAARGQTATSYLKVQPDELWCYEVGGKFDFMGSRLHLMTALFYIDVENFQQQILFKSIGLFEQGNVDTAEIKGGEFELTGNLTRNLNVRLGLGYESAYIQRPGNTFQAAGSPIYQVPKWTATLGGEIFATFTDKLKGFLAVDGSYTGKSLSGNNGTDLTRPAYRLFNLRIGLSWRNSDLAMSLKNATNAQPNLGDITYIGYGLFTDGTRTTPVPQVATLPSRTIMLQLTRRF
jgi:outer membrane receptor protein involved in Fe transport